MPKFKLLLIILALIWIPLYPKFPLVGISGSYVAVRLEDFIVAFLTGVFLFGAVKDKFRIFSLPPPKSILLFLIFGLISAFSGIFLTKTISPSLGLLHTFRRFEYFALFFCGYSFINRRSDLHLIIRVILTVSLIVSLYGLGQQYLNFPVISTANSEFAKGLALSLGSGARINSTFAGHYDLAAFCVFPLLLVISLLTLGKQRLFLILSGLLIYWTILLSASRVTFASVCLSTAIMVILLKKKMWLIPLISLMILGFLASPQLRGRYLEFITNHLSSVQIAPAVYARESDKDVNAVPDALKPSTQPEDRSFNIRIKAEWPKALRAFYKNPILGTGYSSVGLAVDNQYLRILAETGALGLLGFILILLRFYRTAVPYLFSFTPTISNVLIISVSLFMFSLLLNGLFIDVFDASKVAIFTWCMLGITEKAKTLNE